MTKKKIGQAHRHRHKFGPIELDIGGRKLPPFTMLVPCTDSKKGVTLFVTEADVDRALEVNGCGNTLSCAVTQAALRQPEVFSHPVMFVETTDSRFYAYTEFELGKKGAAVSYRHESDIPKLLDFGHTDELRARIRAANGRLALYLGPTFNRAEARKREREKQQQRDAAAREANGGKTPPRSPVKTRDLTTATGSTRRAVRAFMSGAYVPA